MEVTGKQMDLIASFDFQEGSEATSLTARFDMRPKGIMKLVYPRLKPMISKDLPKQGQSLELLREQPTVRGTTFR